MEKYMVVLNFRKVFNSCDVALRTEALLEKLIAQDNWKSTR